jgi:PAS domain S-box-containing protein
MKDLLQKSNFAIVGAGKRGTRFLEFFLRPDLRELNIRIVGVADTNPAAEGMALAKKKGIYATANFRDLYQLQDLNCIIELTGDLQVAEFIDASKPEHIRLIDYQEAEFLLEFLQVEEITRKHTRQIGDHVGDPMAIRNLFSNYSQRVKEFLVRRRENLKNLEKELSAHERILEQIVDGTTIPTFVINKDHIVTHWNRACEKLTGHTAQEIVGTDKHWLPFRSEKRPMMADVIVDAMKEEEIERYYGDKWNKSNLIDGAYEAEEFFAHLGDEGKWLFFTAAPLKTYNQELAERTKKLAASERITTQIIQGSTIPTFVIDENHIITHWNRALEKLSGYPAASMLGTKKQWEPFWENERPSMADVILDQLPEDKIQQLYGTKWQKSTLIRDGYEAEVFFPNLGENGKWCYFTAAPIKSPEGQIIGAIETLWDTTEQRTAQKKLKEYADNLEVMVKKATVEVERRSDFQSKLITSSNDGIIATDQKGDVVIYNHGAERIFGFSESEVIGMLKFDKLFPESLASEVQAGLNRSNDVDLSKWKEVPVKAKNGEIVPTRFSGSILYHEEDIIGSVCFFRDLREIKRLQNELVQSERLAAIGQTVAGLSHYVKNILYGLKGGVYVLNKALGRQDNEKMKSGWEMIERNIGRISVLVMDLLTYSKEREPEPKKCFPNQIVEEVCTLMVAKASEHDIKITTDLDPLLGEVFMDPQAIHHPTLNLITNALDACIFDPDLKEKWLVKVSTVLEKGHIIKLEVSDNGSGMSQETADKLFTSLFSTKGQSGTGLGLLVTEKIVKENGGSINVESELAKGTTFRIYLPFEEIGT